MLSWKLFYFFFVCWKGKLIVISAKLVIWNWDRPIRPKLDDQINVTSFLKYPVLRNLRLISKIDIQISLNGVVYLDQLLGAWHCISWPAIGCLALYISTSYQVLVIHTYLILCLFVFRSYGYFYLVFRSSGFLFIWSSGFGLMDQLIWNIVWFSYVIFSVMRDFFTNFQKYKKIMNDNIKCFWERLL